ncbi:FAD-dependent oxidoreductase [Sphingomonas sp. BIUV-7]|uniref:FAD-dependent oxidoreductase n=1 Tax=Sphingomonas natans TaxID=3063330 RepID=A0ABT8YCW1_9SPHN|nr:FAD-dependent oxidoreductase [Sphingomonas sp. BIUV-7]MDO6416178.1 FAD-dependent oxidoreductase [Sphingomonas sp. BIUV-7]
MSDGNIVILGGGMAGFGAANQLFEMGIKPRMFEQRARPGGLTSSFDHGDGFIFDEGVHISFSKSERVKDIFSQSVGGDVNIGRVYCNNYWRGHWIKHPAQVNLHGLPVDLVVDCISDFVRAQAKEPQPVDNYHDWLIATYGPTFAETFPMVYTRKYHTTDASNMTTDWLGPRLYRPELGEVLHGALEHEPLDVFYVDEFRYPSHGGFEAFMRSMISKADVYCSHRVTSIDPLRRQISFADGSSTEYGSLISSLPLPILAKLVRGAPADVLDAANRLACSQCVVVNIGLNRPINSRAQWSYFYDEDIPFARVSYRNALSPYSTPPGCGALQAEIYFSEKYRPFRGAPEEQIDPAIDALIRCGIVADRSEIIHRSATWLPYANVIFDHERKPALETVQAFVADVGIASCGRFGQWGYIWTDAALLSGEQAARRIVKARAA